MDGRGQENPLLTLSTAAAEIGDRPISIVVERQLKVNRNRVYVGEEKEGQVSVS